MKKEPAPIVIWGDPPPPQTPGGGKVRRAVALALEELRARPNTWGRVATREKASTAASLAARIQKAATYAEIARPGRFEAVARRLDSESTGVWARYIPPPEGRGL